jgi:hypothetical protein
MSSSPGRAAPAPAAFVIPSLLQSFVPFFPVRFRFEIALKKPVPIFYTRTFCTAFCIRHPQIHFARRNEVSEWFVYIFGSLDFLVAETVKVSLGEIEYGFPVAHMKAQITLSVN